MALTITYKAHCSRRLLACQGGCYGLFSQAVGRRKRRIWAAKKQKEAAQLSRLVVGAPYCCLKIEFTRVAESSWRGLADADNSKRPC
jgi:hypothetical protein